MRTVEAYMDQVFESATSCGMWVLKHSETGVGEHSASVAHLAHHIQAIPTGKQKKIEKIENIRKVRDITS